MNLFLDELTFGEWWTQSEALTHDFGTATDSERAHIADCIISYDQIARSLGSPATAAVRATLESLSEVQTENGRSSSREARAEPTALKLTSDEVVQTVELFLELTERTRRDLEALGRRLKAKWLNDDKTPGRVVQRVVRALGIPLEVACRTVPPPLARIVDFAMFPPLPPDCPAVILISQSHLEISKADPFTAARLLLAVAHEIAGHAMDHSDLIVGRRNDEALFLDRELLEGWGIAAERKLSALGRDEHALYQLYKIKRVLPLFPSSMPRDEWAATRRIFTDAWPGFFESAATAVLRRTTGRHARGLIRVERLIRSHGSSCKGGIGNPWQRTTQVSLRGPSAG